MLTGQPLAGELISAAAARAGDLVHPMGDSRGSAEYRRAMVRVLSERALGKAWVALAS
jgi:CO/xanthine dehydrogenase FAD-binding subunit